MELLDVGEVVGAGNLVPQLHHQLSAEAETEVRNPRGLLRSPLVVLAVFSQLVDDVVEDSSFGILKLFTGDASFQDVFSRDYSFVIPDEVDEGDCGFRTDHSECQGVEPVRSGGTGEVAGLPSRELQGLIQPVPGGGGGKDRTRGSTASVDAPVCRLLPAEVDENIIQAVFLGPLDPAFQVSFQVTDPESPEQCGIHIVDVVFVTDVDCGVNFRLRVQPVGDAFRVIAELSVQANLEEGLHDGRERAIQLVQHQHCRFPASPGKPGRDAHRGDSGGLHRLEVRIPDHITFAHRGATDVDKDLFLICRELPDDVRLTDPSRAANQPCDVGRKLSAESLESFDVHLNSPREWGEGK